MIIDWVKKHFWEQWWKGVTFIVVALGLPTFIIQKLKTPIALPLGVLIILILAIFALLWGHAVSFLKGMKKPKFYNYKEAHFPIKQGDPEIKYRWQYVYSKITSKYRIDQISAYCPKDDYKINGLTCSVCEKVFIILDKDALKARIEAQIRSRYNIEPKDSLEDL